MSVLSRLAKAWAERSFGKEHCANYAIRALRTLEEAAELAQALGVPQGTALKCISTVYSRPPGDAHQEIGGVLLTTVILCESMHEEADALLERELARVLAKPPAHFAKRNQEKLDLGLDARSKCVVTTHTDQDGCEISRPQGDWDHRTAGRASFFPECTRPDHVCAAIGGGPCNGLPRPFKIFGDDRIEADRMWRNVAFRNEFDAAAGEAGFNVVLMMRANVADYEDRFNRWALAQIRLGRRAS